MEKTMQFHLEEFDGPLDLLLTLVSKNKMSIYDIEILTLIDQYLAVVGEVGPAEMESASEFIIMAARLVQMKSTLLLPKSDEGERMREELTGLLVEYSACKEVAGKLRDMAEGVYIVVRRPAAVELDTEYRMRHDPAELAAAFEAIMGRSTARRVPRAEQFDDIVAAPFVSVAGRVVYVLRGIVTGKVRQLSQLFLRGASRSETVATFLALLELIRGGRVAIDEKEEMRLAKGATKQATVAGEGAGNGA